MTVAPNAERALAAIAATHQWAPSDLGAAPGKWTHAFTKGTWRILIAVSDEPQARSGIEPLQPGTVDTESSSVQVRRAPVSCRIEAICLEPLGEEDAGGLEIPGLHDEVMFVQVERWMAYLGQEPEAVTQGGAAQFRAVNEMPDEEKIHSWVELAEYWPWTPAPHGYPKIHPDRLGYLTVRWARRRQSAGLIAPQPILETEPRWQFPGLSVSLGEITAVFVFTLLVLALTSVIGGGFFVVITLIGSLYVGPVRRAQARILGLRQLPDAIEYVPWVYPAEELESRSAYTPAGDVGPECAILVVAESICSGIQVKYAELARVLAAAGTQLPDSDALDLDEQLHSIAWAVTDLVHLREQLQQARERGESAEAIEERSGVARIRRAAILRRVTALYGYEKRLTEEIDRRCTAGLDAIFAGNENTGDLDSHGGLPQVWAPAADVPDLTAPLGAAWIDEYAAAGIDGLLASPSTPTDVDVHHGEETEGVFDAEIVDDEPLTAAGSAHAGHHEELHPLATLGQYLQWLRGYVARGGKPTHETNFPFSTAGFLYATTPVTIYADYEYGARSRNIILASGVELRQAFKDPATMFMQSSQDLLRTRGLAHSHVYKMDSFVTLGAVLRVPIYTDPEFDEFRGDDIAVRMSGQ